MCLYSFGHLQTSEERHRAQQKKFFFKIGVGGVGDGVNGGGGVGGGGGGFTMLSGSWGWNVCKVRPYVMVRELRRKYFCYNKVNSFKKKQHFKKNF